MKARVLVVDDEVRLLTALQRSLHERFDIETTTRPAEALRRLEDDGPYCVLLADLRMPDMSGLELLERASRTAPLTVRLLLTGHADQHTLLDAINSGAVFRFLLKPVDTHTLEQTLAVAVRQHRSLVAERELLTQTLRGAVHVLTDVLSLVNPDAFGRATRLAHHVGELARLLDLGDTWELETAAMLSQIGCVVLAGSDAGGARSEAEMSEEERQVYRQHPLLGADLVAQIPRMEDVAAAIRLQQKNYDGSGSPAQSIRGEDLPIGARLLRVATELDRLQAAGLPPEKALSRLLEHPQWYDPRVLAAVAMLLTRRGEFEHATVALENLEAGMELIEDLYAADGCLLMRGGQTVTAGLRQRLLAIRQHRALPREVRVRRRIAAPRPLA